MLETILKDYLNISLDGGNVLCPFHDDDTPSGKFYENENGTIIFKCFACGKTWDFIRYVCKVTGKKDHLVKAELAAYGYGDRVIPVSIITEYNQALKSEETLLKDLERRCIPQEIIDEYQLGANSGRIQIPIPNDAGYYVNIRKHLPGAKRNKVLSQPGYGKEDRLYPIEQIRHTRIILVGGELKALATIAAIRKEKLEDFGAISNTLGENSWDVKRFNRYFRGKIVYICGDVDQTGQKSTVQRARLLSTVAQEVRVLNLPLDTSQYPKGDINDYLYEGGSLRDLITKSERYVYVHERPATLARIPVDLNAKLLDGSFINIPFEAEGRLEGSGDTYFSFPETIEITCNRGNDFCTLCPLYDVQADPPWVLSVDPESEHSLELQGANKKTREAAWKRLVGIPEQCKSCSLTPEYTKIAVPVLVGTEVGFLGGLVITKTGRALPNRLKMDAVITSHPHTNARSIIISGYEPVEEAPEGFSLDLNGAVPSFKSPEAIQDYLEDVHRFYSTEITGIFDKFYQWLLMDLVYHSVTWIPWDFKRIKGWLDILILGEAGCGKTQTAKNLREFYDMGGFHRAESVSAAGLVGGLHQKGSKDWIVSWGLLVSYDKSLLILDEATKISKEHLDVALSARSEGITEINKIRKDSAKTRTRILWLMNPKKQADLTSRGNHAGLVLDLFYTRENVRRLDAATIEHAVADYQVRHPKSSYSEELLKSLPKFAWSRTPNQIRILDETKAELDKFHTRLLNRFDTESIPLYHSIAGKEKLLRLSCALAAKLGSIDDTGTVLIVRPVHVQYCAGLLEVLYSDGKLNLEQHRLHQKRLEEHIEEAGKRLRRVLPCIGQLVENTDEEGFLSKQLLMGLCSDKDVLIDVLSSLIIKRLVKATPKGYKFAPQFIKHLMETADEGVGLPSEIEGSSY